MHLIFSTYGFWLPNDPRGSGSSRVRAQHLFEAGGEATRGATKHSVAGRVHDRQARLDTKRALKYPPVRLTGVQARAIGRGFALVAPKVDLMIHACAIMPEHVHVVVAGHPFNGDEIIACLKRAGTRAVNDAGIHPMAAFARKNGGLPPPWAAGGWKVFLNSSHAVRDRIRYVEQNPLRAGLRRQRWSFVVPYEGRDGA